MDKISGKEVFRWTPPPDLRNNICDDVADEYVITEVAEASSGGIIMWAKYHGKWSANPWNTRTIVRRLLDMQAELEAANDRLTEIQSMEDNKSAVKL